MNDKQLMKRASALAKAECCNLFGKECVQDECRCHLIHPGYATIAEGALDCDWFLEAVLPLDLELSKAIWQELTGQNGPDPPHTDDAPPWAAMTH